MPDFAKDKHGGIVVHIGKALTYPAPKTKKWREKATGIADNAFKSTAGSLLVDYFSVKKTVREDEGMEIAEYVIDPIVVISKEDYDKLTRQAGKASQSSKTI